VATARSNAVANHSNTNGAQLNQSMSNNNVNRAQLILEMSTQIAEQKAKIRQLEDAIVSRDVQIAHVKSHIEQSEKHDLHSSKTQTHRHDAQSPTKHVTAPFGKLCK
jgi:hypothetical protein